ncbi:STAS domain-containing protein [Actinocorallia lasiicapitis]
MNSRRHDAFLILGLTGELQDSTVEAAEAEILTAVILGPAPVHAIIDLSGVTVLDSGGVELLAKTRFAVRSSFGSLRLVAPPGGGPRRVLDLSGLTFPILDALAHALEPVPEAAGREE